MKLSNLYFQTNIMISYFNSLFIACDAPRPWGVYFQDSASPQMEALVELHDSIIFYLVIILFGVAWIMVSIIRNYVYSKSAISDKYLNHGTLTEIIWTITPALILVLIAFPSFKLLYLMDEVTDPSLTLFIGQDQWYWSYQYPDFISDDNEELEFDSYLVPELDSKDWATILYDCYSQAGMVLSEFLSEGSSNVSLGGSSSGEEMEDLVETSDANNCTHDHWSPYPLGVDGVEEQNNINHLLCDFNALTDEEKHNAFPADYQGLHDPRRPETCNRCHLVRCDYCHVEYSDSE